MTARKVQLVIITTAVIGGGALEARAEPAGKPIAVVVNRANKMENISSEFLRSTFLKRRRRWPDGKPVMVINASPRSPLRKTFDKRALDLSITASATYWIQRKIRGEGTPPVSVGSSAARLRLVAYQPQAICYVPLDVVKGSKVRVLKIDGKHPSDKGYPLVMPAGAPAKR